MIAGSWRSICSHFEFDKELMTVNFTSSGDVKVGCINFSLSDGEYLGGLAFDEASGRICMLIGTQYLSPKALQMVTMDLVYLRHYLKCWGRVALL